jgi:hypothetical protein
MINSLNQQFSDQGIASVVEITFKAPSSPPPLRCGGQASTKFQMIVVFMKNFDNFDITQHVKRLNYR